MSATRILLHTTKAYNPSLEFIIRRDLQRTGWAYLSCPQYFVADAEKLRHMADVFHDWADKIEGNTQ